MLIEWGRTHRVVLADNLRRTHCGAYRPRIRITLWIRLISRRGITEEDGKSPPFSPQLRNRDAYTQRARPTILLLQWGRLLRSWNLVYHGCGSRRKSETSIDTHKGHFFGCSGKKKLRFECHIWGGECTKFVRNLRVLGLRGGSADHGWWGDGLTRILSCGKSETGLYPVFLPFGLRARSSALRAHRQGPWLLFPRGQFRGSIEGRCP